MLCMYMCLFCFGKVCGMNDVRRRMWRYTCGRPHCVSTYAQRQRRRGRREQQPDRDPLLVLLLPAGGAGGGDSRRPRRREGPPWVDGDPPHHHEPAGGGARVTERWAFGVSVFDSIFFVVMVIIEGVTSRLPYRPPPFSLLCTQRPPTGSTSGRGTRARARPPWNTRRSCAA